jgi:hypothetical protein
MKESYRKGVAIHPGPESCVASRKAATEALTGAHAGRVLSCEIIATGVPTLFSKAEGHTHGCANRKHPEDFAQSEAPGMLGNSTRENRETPSAPVGEVAAGRLEKAMSRESNMHAGGESDGSVLPTKCPNKGGQPPAEGMEGREPTKENTGQATAPRTQSRTSELSDLLRDSFYALKRDAAPGVDGTTWKEYEAGLDEKLADVHSRIHRGTYRAQPSKRAYIPASSGESVGDLAGFSATIG